MTKDRVGGSHNYTDTFYFSYEKRDQFYSRLKTLSYWYFCVLMFVNFRTVEHVFVCLVGVFKMGTWCLLIL